MFAPQKSVNLTFFQRFVDYNWPTRKRTVRHILSQLSVGPSLCRSRSSQAPPKFPSETFRNFRNWLWPIKKLRDKERQEKGMCQPYKRFRNFADAGSLQRKLNFGKFLSAIPRRARCQRRIISPLEGSARVTYCSPPYHTSGNSRISFCTSQCSGGS